MATTRSANRSATAKPKRTRATRNSPRSSASRKAASDTRMVRALSLGSALAVLGAAAYGAYRLLARPAEGTMPTDLMGDAHPDGSDRAIDAFRPDPTAPVPASEREALQPALAVPERTIGAD